MNFENLPKKDHYRFKEVTSLTGVKPYVLRFWESEFPQIAPVSSEGGDKIYSQLDLQCVEKIRDLLFDDKLSIPQAKMYLDKELRRDGATISLLQESTTNSLPEIPTPETAGNIQATPSHHETEPLKSDFTNEPPKIMYRGVETKASIGSLFSNKASSVQDLQMSLKNDLDAHKEVLFKKQFNDHDVLRLVQAKKKLASLLVKIDSIIETKRWS